MTTPQATFEQFRAIYGGAFQVYDGTEGVVRLCLTKDNQQLIPRFRAFLLDHLDNLRICNLLQCMARNFNAGRGLRSSAAVPNRYADSSFCSRVFDLRTLT